MKIFIWFAVVFCVFFSCNLFLRAAIKSFAVVTPVIPLDPPKDFRVRVIEAVLLGEARSDGPGGVARVAEVIRNRMIQSHRTAIHEVTRPFQFSCLNGIIAEALLEQRADWVIPQETVNEARWCAAQLVFPHGAKFASTDLTHGATHYHAAGPKPNWVGDRRPCHTYKGHIFYRLN